MKRTTTLITSCVCCLALGSVVALAQSTPPEAAPQVKAVEAVTEPISAPTDEPQANAPTIAAESAPVEDAPVDVPGGSQSNWAPDINLDAQNQEDQASTTPKRKAKPRKILSDAGENVLGTGSWSQSGGSEAAQTQLLSRANRRERAVDPIKRSELTKLSRVMGALHALRVSCSGRDDQTYRSRMATMLDLEAPDSGALRDPLVDAFNGGFQANGRGASACPSDARVQEASLAKDGYMVARTLSTRYRTVPKAQTALPPATQPRVNVAPIASAPAPTPAAAPAASAPQKPKAARPSWTVSTPN